MRKRDTIVRYTAPERINHWITAFCFILAAVSGLGFFFPSFNWLMHILGTPQRLTSCYLVMLTIPRLRMRWISLTVPSTLDQCLSCD